MEESRGILIPIRLFIGRLNYFNIQRESNPYVVTIVQRGLKHLGDRVRITKKLPGELLQP